ncbi:group XIIA secretory phospholipase A2-like isoform X2 [Salmo salar]|uniref:Group XIIA secretory phospholipase A2-like isoform X2 n=1 Tax=Salmo salar TaxID=8030 RepID=A0A1S3SL54_SALSA|nr:group XIIA secretory phospholipase A2-like isoform X2 [Salmo salar]
MCHYECIDGYKLEAQPGYKPSPPNGCGSPLLGFQFDIGIPSLTKCCNQHDRCYDTCNRDKHDCDNEFQECLETICRRLQKMLGLAQSVQVDIDNPTLTKFCDQHNCCYAICNSDKDDCDDEFQECLERDFCRRLQKMLGLA